MKLSVDGVCGSICIIKHIDTISFGKSYSYHLLTLTSKVLMMQPSLLLLHAGTSLRLAKLLSVVVKSLKQTLAILPKAAAILIRSLLWSRRFTGLKIELKEQSYMAKIIKQFDNQACCTEFGN